MLQAWVEGITGLPGDLVRPRWQPVPAPQPDQGVNWCAIAVMRGDPDSYVWLGQGGTDPGVGTMQRHEDIEALATFYGPSCMGYAARLSDGAMIEQNRDVLTAAGTMLTGTGTVVLVPELSGQIWIRRADIAISLRREVIRTYPVRTLLDAPTSRTNDPF